MNEGFYRAFEECHRGPRELIKSRLGVYLPFVKPLLAIYAAAEAIDLGCGRGEWLELLQEVGFDARGVDLDDGMLAACREIGLNVHTDEAVKFLKELADSSQVVVSGFHIAEHIPFPDLQVLVQEALRALKPGGLLILETPNPENVVVGTASFYLDPTHHQPIPPGLLSFLPEYYGFERVKILRLQESLELSANQELTLFNVLAGVSPDYAVVAQKAGATEIMAVTDAAFATEFGLTLDSLAGKYDQQVKALAQQALYSAAQAEARAQQALDNAAQAHARASQAASVAQDMATQLSAVYSSTSWGVTKPLRACKRMAGGAFTIWRRLKATSLIKAKLALRPVVSAGIEYVYRYPALQIRLKQFVQRFPSLHQRLRRIAAINTVNFDNDGTVLSALSASMYDRGRFSVSLTLRSPLAHRIYGDLKAAIEKAKLGED